MKDAMCELTEQDVNEVSGGLLPLLAAWATGAVVIMLWGEFAEFDLR